MEKLGTSKQTVVLLYLVCYVGIGIVLGMFGLMWFLCAVPFFKGTESWIPGDKALSLILFLNTLGALRLGCFYLNWGGGEGHKLGRKWPVKEAWPVWD